MDPNNEPENTDLTLELDGDSLEESTSVEDFIRELEAKEKDLHITAETTFIELAAGFDDDAEMPEFLRGDVPAPPAKQTVKPAAASPADTGEVRKLEGEVASLKARIAGLEEERKELYQNAQRRLKDFEAFKSRTERERGETFQRQLSNLATQMLPALDNLDRALQCAPTGSEEEQAGFTQFFDGIVLVNQQVNEVLAEMGIVPIDTVGEEFDPHLHEAVAVDDSADVPPNTITSELLRGFRIGDNVIRHSMVKVAKGQRGGDPTVEKEVDTGDPPDEDPGAEQNAAEDEPVETAAKTDPDLETGFAIERNGEVDE